jgi:PhzF family phenazine biosynthesis protein
MGLPLYQVDAFTDHPFAGNPAAVCLLDGPRADAWHAAVAAEMNLSETAFVLRVSDGFSLRWFTPAVEVDLCGHATLASAHVLWETGRLAADEAARFHTRSGLLVAHRERDAIAMDLPATPDAPADVPPGLVEALGATPSYVGRSVFDYLVGVADEATVRALSPDIAALGRIDARGFIVTARADAPGVDFVSRFFAPAVGVAEDPVTGSAHACLGPYWGRVLGRDTFVAHQVSARGGTLGVRLAGGRVVITGRAVTVVAGELVGG